MYVSKRQTLLVIFNELQPAPIDENFFGGVKEVENNS